MNSQEIAEFRDETLCVRHREPDRRGFTALTVPVERASTIVFPSAAAYDARNDKGPDAYSYGLHGTPTVRALESQIAVLEGAVRSLVVPSGLAAVTVVFLAYLKPGETVLLPDTVYPPVREFADKYLATQGIKVVYYDPAIGSGIAVLLDRPVNKQVRLILVESPGSTTMEIQDLPAIIAAARDRGVKVACDNTWATPLLLKPLAFGADISIQALSKYVGGHSDLLLGSIAVSDYADFERLKTTIKLFGFGVSVDECSLALRGIETMAVRLERSGESAIKLAQFLERQPVIAKVLHPALPGFSGHDLWRRDFKGAAGVFSVIVHPDHAHRLALALDAMRLFSIGASWGGTRSLVAPMKLAGLRTATAWDCREPVVRFSTGVEAIDDLLEDIGRFCHALGERGGVPDTA